MLDAAGGRDARPDDARAGRKAALGSNRKIPQAFAARSMFAGTGACVTSHGPSTEASAVMTTSAMLTSIRPPAEAGACARRASHAHLIISHVTSFLFSCQQDLRGYRMQALRERRKYRLRHDFPAIAA